MTEYTPTKPKKISVSFKKTTGGYFSINAIEVIEIERKQKELEQLKEQLS